mgnify:FL=1
MSRQVWKGSTLLNPEPPVLVSCGAPEKPNLITVGWTGTICTQPPMLSISVRPERYSHHLIKESGEFVVNLPTESLVRAIDWCGVKSGRDVDKFAAMHLTAAPAAKADNGSIPGEIIAAISAAVATVCGGNAVIRGIKRVSKPAAGSRRGAWGDAGVREHTTPFM